MTALVRSELLKLRTTRAPFVLLLAVVVVSGLAVAGAVGADVPDPRSPAIDVADAAEITGILAIMLGLLLVTNEYRHGTITPTFLVAPVRERVVAAKVVAGAIAGLAAGAGAALVAFTIAIPWLSARDAAVEAGDTADAALRLIGEFALSGILGVAIGTLLRSQIGAIIATFAWFLVLEPVVWGLGGLIDVGVMPYLPGSTFDALVSSDEELLAAPWALLLSLLYVAVVLAVGTALTVRGDAD